MNLKPNLVITTTGHDKRLKCNINFNQIYFYRIHTHSFLVWLKRHILIPCHLN